LEISLLVKTKNLEIINTFVRCRLNVNLQEIKIKTNYPTIKISSLHKFVETVPLRIGTVLFVVISNTGPTLGRDPSSVTSVINSSSVGAASTAISRLMTQSGTSSVTSVINSSSVGAASTAISRLMTQSGRYRYRYWYTN